MIVRCIKNPRPDDMKLKSLLMSHDHLVLGICFYEESKYMNIIDPRDNEPGAWDFSCFEVIDPRIPDGWIIEKRLEDRYVLYPETFAKENFWDDYYSGYAWAREAFEEVVRGLYKFHGLRYPKKRKRVYEASLR
jgi:hypothetical protein